MIHWFRIRPKECSELPSYLKQREKDVLCEALCYLVLEPVKDEKKRKKEYAKQKVKEVKQIQITVRAAKNDLDIKAKKMNEFLTEGHPINLVMVLRGREKANKDWARLKLEEFMKLITVSHQKVSDIRWGGRGLNIQIVKK